MKIALVGSASSSAPFAPYGDPSWVIWGCSPGAVPFLRRVDAFFEIHRWLPGENGFEPGFIEWMKGLPCPIYTLGQQPALPTSVPYPVERILAKHQGLEQSFFTSSLAWMLALAIEMIAEERKRTRKKGDHGIGLWGVDMADDSEYFHQKPGCHFFILKALEQGIKVTVPPESDLLRPIPLYGIGEGSDMSIRMAAWMKELEGRRALVQQELTALDKQYQEKRYQDGFLAGAQSAGQHFKRSWIR